MTALQILGNLLAAGAGFGLLLALLLGGPSKGASRFRFLLFGASSLLTCLALHINRIIENPPGIWWWLGVGGCTSGVLASIGWLYLAATHWPKQGAVPQKMRLRPVGLLLLLLGDGVLLVAFRVHAPAVQVLLVVLPCLVLFAFTQVVWEKQETT